MSDKEPTIADIGEKRIIREWLRPLLNPSLDPNLAGDDCAMIECRDARLACASTDRVPADLISFRLGLIDFYGLGYYLAILNLSDLAAMGATPRGLLLNMGVPQTLRFADFKSIVLGCKSACETHGCLIVGGDISSSSELSLSATSIGSVSTPVLLRRTGASPGDLVYCTKAIGLTPAAFFYFLHAREHLFSLPQAQEDSLCRHFRKPEPAFGPAGVLLSSSHRPVTAMDNTDGVGQSLLELAEANGVAIIVDPHSLPLDPIALEVVRRAGASQNDLLLGPGADFQLVGTVSKADATQHESKLSAAGITLIGEVIEGEGLHLAQPDGTTESFTPRGWDYFGGEYRA